MYSCFMGKRANFTNWALILVLYYTFVFVSLKFFTTYHNIDVFLLCVLTYYTYNGTEYSDSYSFIIPQCYSDCNV